jgi:hypothetical protein
MKIGQIQFEKPSSFWQSVFLQSRVNGAPYCGEQLPLRRWNWPSNTYLQRRLRLARAFGSDDPRDFN